MVLLKTKKNTILILLIVFCILFAGAGGYLLWRVNQEDSLGPGDSDAGQSNNGSCRACCTPEIWNQYGYCPSSQATLCGCTTKCGDGVTIPIVCGSNPATACPNCYHAAPGSEDPVGGVKCNVGSQCKNVCYWPQVAYCTGTGDCTCKAPPGNNCNDTEPKCKPSCPSGYVECSGSSCGSDTKTASCSARCSGCDNLYYVKITCKKVASNSCDSGSWNKKPSGQYNYCDPIEYDALAKDSDGIDANTISVKLNGQGRSSYKKSESATQATISETLSTSSKCLEPGTYTLDLSWKDKKGNASSACTLTTTFTIGEPGWSVQKNVVESCIDEKTSSPKARLSYVIAVKNLSQSSRKITKIVDNLDPKVRKDQMGSISKGGTFSNGVITWNLSGTDAEFLGGQQKTYTYSYLLGKLDFGRYINTVTVYPESGSSLSDSAEIVADCIITNDEPLPDTALPTESSRIIKIGAILLFLGILWGLLMDMFSSARNSLVLLTKNIGKNIKKANKEKEESNIRKRRNNFEKKVVKK